MSIRITYFVHGTTKDNENGIATGQLPGELSELGIEQARELGMNIEGNPFDAVFSSDLQRAVDSARFAFGNRHEIIYDQRLREINYGDWNGKSDSFKDRMTDFIDTQFPNGESYQDVKNRMRSFLDEMKETYDQKHIAIVAHQSPQLALESICNGKTLQQAIDTDWRKTSNWQPGWMYILRKSGPPASPERVR